MSKKLPELSLKAKEVLEHLEKNGASTIAEMKERGLDGVNSAHLTALRNRGLVVGNEMVKEVVTVAKRKVLEYSIVETDTETETDTE